MGCFDSIVLVLRGIFKFLRNAVFFLVFFFLRVISFWLFFSLNVML